MRAALFTSLLLATTTTAAANNRGGNGKGNNKKLGGFETFDDAAASTPSSSATVGQCTITSTKGTVCSTGIAQSFTLSDIYGTEITYTCDCPTACEEGNAGIGSYTCTITHGLDHYSDDLCGDIDIASVIFADTNTGCSMDQADGTMRCEENCYCDAEAHLCTSVGEECCAGSCQKVTGPGVKGWELKCMAESDDGGKTKNLGGQSGEGLWEEAA
mmetsp:Transcript_13964/g.19829  ORF Transcript_13964/g.19829 Transcript_13964/m.19829 type:complete len:215 (+) Transcript_13964:89-733(+)|eukprot:CAMPEP_0201686902 /NCGR_PEP_ID=MMETSP0578-20130828/1169_1 /ASSEMBLY_ACC=CAM_ASM_000663 /TAXON_ID=267565 /ORGANISM="Skeletonema grethea, Strain CCMP 1804" /LENGTH=214 /DNA_ID=CAMNT_0048171009 /DNA_START=76 /DNA_END=720 /DNA_ORIENTATION=-